MHHAADRGQVAIELGVGRRVRGWPERTLDDPLVVHGDDDRVTRFESLVRNAAGLDDGKMPLTDNGPMQRAWIAIGLAGSIVGCAVVPPQTATPAPSERLTPSAEPSPTLSRTPRPSATLSPDERLTAGVVVDLIDRAKLREHLEALQQIADAHGGHRASGSTGFEASRAYVAARLEAAGYEVEHLPFTANRTTGTNLLAERPGSGPEVVMIGAHLDSDASGPGINDNGSGVATVLVIAEILAGLPPPTETIRFAFWDAEEGDPFGSRAYVEELSEADRERIGAYLNFDMVGSPNPIRLVYAEADAAPGSEGLTRLVAAYFAERELSWAPIDLEGDSDQGPFIDAGIPTGGLFSGGIELVTDAQAAAFGADGGEPADPCSHRACDTIENVDLKGLELMARAITHAVVRLATD